MTTNRSCLDRIKFGLSIGPFLLLLAAMPVSLLAQNTTKATGGFTLTGSVKDKSTGESLPFATVQVKGTKIAAPTNADGYFTLSRIPSDTSTIVVRYPGYAPTELKLTVGMPKSGLLIEIVSSSKELNEVVVTGTRQDVVLSDKNTVGVIKMTPAKLAQLPNIGEKDIMRSFQLMPGISASNESSSGLYVRGGTPDQNLVLYDGFTIYHVDHLYGFFSAFNANALKDVQLYKGGFESRFGGRLSSVTEITGKDGNQKKFTAGADLSFLSLNAYAEIPIGDKFSSVLAYRRSYKGPLYNSIFSMFNPAAAESGGTTEAKPGESGRSSTSSTVASYFYDMNGKFTYRPSSKDIISLSLFNGTDNLDNSQAPKETALESSASTISTSSTDLTNYGNFGSSLKWSRKWSDKFYGNTILSYSNYYSDRNNSQSKSLTNAAGVTQSSSQGTFENNDLKDFSFKSDYQYDLHNSTQLQFGLFATGYDIQYDYAQNDTVSIISKSNKSTLAGAYLQSKFRMFGDKLQFLPGLRASSYSATGKMYLEPRATLTYDLSDKLTLKAATGKYYQFANRVTREDILQGSRDFWILSDGTSIPVSSAVHYVVGLAYENKDYLFSMEGYYKKLSNISEYSLRINSGGGEIGYNENFFTGQGQAKGLEFLAQKKSGNFNGWLSYTLGQARNQFDIYSDTYYPANQDVTHEFKAVALYKLSPRWDASATFVYASGRPYTAPSGAYSVTLLDGTVQNFYTVTAKNGQTLPNYHRMDLALNYKLFKKQKTQELGAIGFSVFNVLNRTNVWYKQYTIVSNEIIENNVNYMGITPNLTFTLKIR